MDVYVFKHPPLSFLYNYRSSPGALTLQVEQPAKTYGCPKTRQTAPTHISASRQGRKCSGRRPHVVGKIEAPQVGRRGSGGGGTHLPFRPPAPAPRLPLPLHSASPSSPSLRFTLRLSAHTSPPLASLPPPLASLPPPPCALRSLFTCTGTRPSPPTAYVTLGTSRPRQPEALPS